MKNRGLPSVMTHRFSETPQVDIPRSQFDRSHGYKTTFDAGYLVPIFVDEVLPGDTFNLNTIGFARLATPYFPVMDNMFLDTFYFAVPLRLIWDNFKKAMGERANPADHIDYTVPVIDDINNESNESLTDYFGLPTLVGADYSVNALFYRAYNLIYNEWFRDQNLQDSVVVNTDDGPDSIADYTLLKRCKRHDYFTSALPWLQKGDSVQLALGIEAPIRLANFNAGGTADDDYYVAHQSVTPVSWHRYDPSWGTGGTNLPAGGNYNLYADLNSATASTVNELREAIQTQRLLEKDARAGSRYTEIVKSHFGVNSEDSRQQRPEYLGGGTTPVSISAIARTDSTPGDLGAFGVSAFRNHGFVKSFTEHCVIIGLVNVRADITYQNGINKMWSRSTRYDFYWPTLAHLGEQAILNKEIYVDASDLGDGTSEEVFGYQERFAEYRYKPSMVTGKFRSNDPATLDAWHLGVEFADTPALSDSFIQDNPPLDRVIRVPSEPHFIFDSYHQLRCIRPMPVRSIPGYIDHF